MKNFDDIYTFSVIQHTGKYLVLHKGSKIQRSLLEQVSLKMIQHNQLLHILPVTVEEIDLNVSLYYEITGKQSFLEYLQTHSFKMKDFYTVLTEIVSSIHNNNQYMMQADKYFIYNEKYIFIGKNLADIHLVYIPLKEIEQKQSLQRDLEQLSNQLIKYIKDFDAISFSKVTTYLKSSIFTLETFKDLLASLYNQPPAISVKEEIPVEYSVRGKKGIGRVIERLFAKKKQVEEIITPIEINKELAHREINIQLPIEKKKEKVMRQDDATVLLGSGPVKSTPSISLQLQDGELIDVMKDSFVIGRNEDKSDYVIQTVGVSRMHIEIVKMANHQYGVKDLGSKNSSKLNGIKMESFELYPIKENDVITFATNEITIKMRV